MGSSKAKVRYHRRSIRLPDYDYTTEGGYFITCVTHQRMCLFGQICIGEMQLNSLGKIIQEEWFRTSRMRPNIELYEDEFVVMPNHIHGIIWITEILGRGSLQRTPTLEQFQKPVSNSIPTIIRLFKATTTKQINCLRNTPGEPIWQRNYYEHIIGSERDYDAIAEYIFNNPLGWDTDQENTNNKLFLE